MAKTGQVLRCQGPNKLRRHVVVVSISSIMVFHQMYLKKTVVLFRNDRLDYVKIIISLVFS